MLKKLFKAALTACLVAGMSSAAMAYTEIGKGMYLDFSGASSFGQYTGSGENDSAYLMGKSEYYISINAVSGPWTMWGQIEWDDRATLAAPGRSTTATDSAGDTHTQDGSANNDLDRAQSYIKYAVTPEFAINLGTTHTWVQYALSGGASVAKAVHEGWDYAGYVEEPGVKFSYKITPTITAAFALYGNAAVEMTGQSEGSANSIGVAGTMGALAFQVGMVTETYDDFQNANDENPTNSFTNLGVKYSISDAMAVSFDYSMATLSWGTVDRKETVADMALQFTMKNLGPGNITVCLASIAGNDPDEVYTYHWSRGVLPSSWAESTTQLVYGIPIGPGEIKFQYASRSFTPKDMDALTDSYLGVAFKFGI